jgi:hypothetical protein
MADGNLVRQPKTGKGSVVFGPSVYDVPLLPFEKELIKTIGITEEEYRKFAAEVRRKGLVRPASYSHVPEILNTGEPVSTAILINLAISLVLTGVAYLLTPKPKMPSAGKRDGGGTVDLEGFTGPSRFTPSRGFESLAKLADYGAPIPIVFGLYDEDDKVGGMLITPNLVWSRMFSDGTQQRAKLLFVVGEQGLVNDEAESGIAAPDLEGIFLGNNALDQIYDDLFAFYWKPNSDNLVQRIRGGDLQYGSKGTAESGDPDGPKGDEEAFLCPTSRSTAEQGFCHAFSPANNTEFGVYAPIANGNSYRLNYQALTVFYKDGDDRNPKPAQRRKQITERIKIVGDQNYARDNGKGYNSGELRQEVEDGILKRPVGKGRNYSPRMGLYRVDKTGGSTITTDSGTFRKVVAVEEGDTAFFLISPTKIDKDLYGTDDSGASVEDINTTVRSLQLAADDAMQLGELFAIGGTIWKVINRSQVRFDPDQNEDGNPQSQYIKLKCIDTSTSIDKTVGIVSRDFVIEPNREDRKNYIDDIINVGESFYPLTKVSFARIRNNRPSSSTEFGIRSNVYQNLQGICAFNSLPSPARIADFGEDFVNINTGTITASIVRSSVFRIFIRIAGKQDGVASEFQPLPQFFVVRGSKPVAQYNSLRITKSISRDPVEFEFKFVAVPGSELRLEGAEFELCELDQQYDGQDAVKTETSLIAGIGELQVTYTGRRVTKASISENIEFFRGATVSQGSTTIDKPNSVSRKQVVPGSQSGTRVEAIERVYNIGPSGFQDYGKNGAFSHEIAGSADNGPYSNTPEDGFSPAIRTREFQGFNWVVIEWRFQKKRLGATNYAHASNGATFTWVPREANVVGSSRGFNVGNQFSVLRGQGDTSVFGGGSTDYGDDNPFKNNHPSGTLTFSGRRFEVTEVSQVDILGGRNQGYLYTLFGDADALSVGQKSIKVTESFNESNGRNIKVQLQSEVVQLTDSFSGQRNGWSQPTVVVVQDNDTTSNWEAGDTFTHTVAIDTGSNPFANGYGSVGFIYEIGSISKTTTPATVEAEEKFVTTSQLSDISLYRSLVQKSNEREPEHTIVYINETQENETVPSYSNLTLAGLSLRASRNFTQLDQLRCWLGSGLQVKRLHPQRTATYGNGREIGSSNLFADLVFHLLTDQMAGAGALLGMKTNDASMVDESQMIEAAKFMKTQKLYFNGPVTDRANVRQFIMDLAPSFLCNFIVSDGKFSLKPALPYYPESGSINLGAVQIDQLFTSGNILEDTFKVEYLRAEERRPFKAVVRYRHEQQNKLPEERSIEVTLKGQIAEDNSIDLLPQEQFDLTQFCTSQHHAEMVAKYFISLRKLITHTISFSTTLEGLNIAAGSYIKVITESNPYSSANNGTINSSGGVTSVEDLTDGQYEVSYFRTDSEDVKEGIMNVSNGRVADSEFHDSVFSLKNSTVQSNVYVVEQLTFSQEGTVDIVASEHPCDDENRSELASLVTSDLFRIF